MRYAWLLFILVAAVSFASGWILSARPARVEPPYLVADGARVFGELPLSVVNVNRVPMTAVQWWVSPWDAKGDPDDQRYWSMPRFKDGMGLLHNGKFRVGMTIAPGDYRIEFNAVVGGVSRQYVQHLTVP